ncbi:YerC/YecD family TrpR-related protein [Carnobacterium gallinarum]|uniref:YerC/YecD family TrpR-related protein n=1 Tax=Carnobacterium gallinarum TaxID=2749 RepID=UPI0005553AA8|nr:YerC/YecD family TrpR-related protein [Carnobacterium gallinarum]
MQIDKIRDQMLDQFFDGILALESKEDCLAFFDDLLTLNEIKTMVQRYQVAKMLYEKKTYSVIEKETHASTATIARVKRSLFDGNDSYDMLFKRIAATKMDVTEEEETD